MVTNMKKIPDPSSVLHVGPFDVRRLGFFLYLRLNLINFQILTNF